MLHFIHKMIHKNILSRLVHMVNNIIKMMQNHMNVLDNVKTNLLNKAIQNNVIINAHFILIIYYLKTKYVQL